MTYKELEELVQETYLVADGDFLKLVLASIIANRLPISPVWLFIVGPSGSGKTEFINLVGDCKWIVAISSITASTFASGQKGKGNDPSLLHQIPVKRGAVLVLKDFTSMLSLPPDARNAIMAQLREIYDGEYTKRFGNGNIIQWKGQLGMLAGVTDVIYGAREMYAQMGERFIMYAPIVPDRKEVTMRAMDNVKKMSSRRELLKIATKEYLDVEIDPLVEAYRVNGPPDISQQLKHDIAILAEFATRARSPVERDWYSREKSIKYAYMPEMPTRLAEQLVSISVGLMIINEQTTGECKLTNADEQTMYRIALDCLPPQRREVLRRLTMYFQATAAAMATELQYPATTVKRWLEDLTALKVLDMKKAENGRETWWLKSEYRLVMAKYEGLIEMGDALPDPETQQEKSELESIVQSGPLSPDRAW